MKKVKFLAIVILSIGFLVFIPKDKIFLYHKIHYFFNYELPFSSFEIISFENLSIGNDPSDSHYGVELRVKQCKAFEQKVKNQNSIVTEDSLRGIVPPFFYEKILKNEGILFLRATDSSKLEYAISFYDKTTCKLYFEYTKY